jgi:hypothetical protein
LANFICNGKKSGDFPIDNLREQVRTAPKLEDDLLDSILKAILFLFKVIPKIYLQNLTPTGISIKYFRLVKNLFHEKRLGIVKGENLS